MSKNGLIKRAFLDASGVVIYVAAFAWSVNMAHQWFGSGPSGWPALAFFLVVFIISACITGSLVLLKPILLYVEGEKKQAGHLFVYTLLFLVILAMLIGFLSISFA